MVDFKINTAVDALRCGKEVKATIKDPAYENSPVVAIQLTAEDGIGALGSS